MHAKNIVDNYILYAASKYGRGNISKYLNDYMRGNQNAITRDGNYRNLFAQNVSVQRLQEIVDGNIEGYIAKVCKQSLNTDFATNQHQNNVNYRLDIDDVKNILDSYILLAITKYGISNVPKYLNDYMRGNQRAITRDNNYRNLFNTYVSSSLIPVIMGYDIESYIQNVAFQFSGQIQMSQARHI